MWFMAEEALTSSMKYCSRIAKQSAPMIFLLDHFFLKVNHWLKRYRCAENDKLIFADVTYEPKTTQVDKFANDLKEEFGSISGIIGIGGGSVMDLAKAVSLMMNNPGSSADYQGWDLVKYAGVYKVGIPTLSGTGAEVSRTCVLTGPERKTWDEFGFYAVRPNCFRS